MKKCPRKNISWKRALLYVFLVLTAVLMLIPFFWMVLSSLKSESELFALPLKIFPERWRFDNYLTLWNSAPWVTYFLNTLKVTALTILGQVVSCSMAAYGFARLKFKGKNLIFLAFLGSMMIPYQAIMIPQFVIISKLGRYPYIPHRPGHIQCIWHSAYIPGIPWNSEEPGGGGKNRRVFPSENLLRDLL